MCALWNMYVYLVKYSLKMTPWSHSCPSAYLDLANDLPYPYLACVDCTHIPLDRERMKLGSNLQSQETIAVQLRQDYEDQG